MDGDRLLVRPELGTTTPSVSTYLLGDFLMPRSGLHPIKSLEQTQVMQKQTSNSSASGFHCQSLGVSGWTPAALRVQGGKRGEGKHSLCVQMGPSQPSLQTHVKDSPLTTQVPPLWQGLGRQLLFRAMRKEQTRPPSLRIQRQSGGAETRSQETVVGSHAHGPCEAQGGRKGTYVTGRSFPASGTHALESVPLVIAGATIVARSLITLAVTWKRRSRREPLAGPAHGRQGRIPAGHHLREWQVLPFHPFLQSQ